jgi:integrase
MSVLFNHAQRYDLFDGNSISLVRQSAKRQKIPEVLGVDELQRLLQALRPRERTLVLMAAGTGLRMSELFGLMWKDVDFKSSQLSVTRSIVDQVVGPCKTEASQKPVPLDSSLAKALRDWRRRTRFGGPDDWLFASPHTTGSKPYRGQPLMRYYIQPTARRIGIMKRIGWHTFRHYSESRTITG